MGHNKAECLLVNPKNKKKKSLNYIYKPKYTITSGPTLGNAYW